MAEKEPNPRHDPFLLSYMEEFVGQQSIKHAVRWEVKAAKTTGRSGHFLAYGRPGCGKTVLGQIIAMDLDLPLITSMASEFGNVKDARRILTRMARVKEPFFWLVEDTDEISRSAAHVLHPVIANNVFENESRQQLPLQPVTLYFTTNRIDLVPEGIRSRCRIKLKFEAYTREELAKIAIASAHRLDYSITYEAADLLADKAVQPREVATYWRQSLPF